MRCLALLLVACSGSSKPADSTTTVTTTQDPPPAHAAPAGTPPPVTELQPAASPPAPPVSQPVTTPSQVASKQPLYSCFSYIAANTTTKRHNCMRTPDCPDLLEQATQLKGIRELTGCASVDSVWCFHQVVKGDAEGVDVCQPTQADCATARTAAVKAKESVDTDCTQR